MGAFRLLRLRLKNFRSFADEVEIPFNLKGMMLLRGKNWDTGGSSYSGKSSLPVAIQMAFGNCPFSVKDQKTWGSDGPMVVGLDFETQEGVWTIRRGDKTSLKTPDGTTITSASAVDAKLREVLGVDADILAALTYRRQKKPGVFLLKTDAEKKDFLSRVMGLEAIEAAIADSEERLKALELERMAIHGNVVAVESQARSVTVVEPTLVSVETLVEKECQLMLEDLDLSTEVTTLRGKVKALDDQCVSAQLLVEERHASQLEALQRRVSEARQTQVPKPQEWTPPAELVAALGSARQRLAKKVKAEEDRIKEEKELQKRLADAREALKTKEWELGSLNMYLSRYDRDIEGLRNSFCVNCNQLWRGPEADASLKEKEAERLALKEKLGVADAEINALKQKVAFLEAAPKGTKDPMIDRMNEVVSQLEGDLRVQEANHRAEQQALLKEHRFKAELEVAAATSALSDLNAVVEKQKLEALQDLNVGKDKLGKALEAFRAEAQVCHQRLSEVRLAIKTTEVENQARKAIYEQRKAESERLSQELGTWRQVLATHDEKLAAEKDFQEFIGYKGFLGSIFDEILAEITEETNAILASVANTAHVTIHFTSESTTLKGSVRKEIKPVVTIGGYQANLESGASGGMLTSIDLAVDLAVANVVSRRTNSWPGWMILDESFEGLDPVSKESCIEMLSRHAENRLIVVVDHASETKELFSQSIDVEFRNGRSTIKESE